jgi:hypothetical protein
VKAREFDQVISKFGMETRRGRDIHAWLTHDGKVVVRTKRSGGRGDPPVDLVRNQLKLNEEQLREAVTCTLGLDGYLVILRDKGVL